MVAARDAGGKPTGSTFRMSASMGNAGCALTFDPYGDAGRRRRAVPVASMQGSRRSTARSIRRRRERIATPEGGAGCTGLDCDGAAFVLSALDATHVTGYFMGNVTADSGAGDAAVICSFWLKPRTYTP